MSHPRHIELRSQAGAVNALWVIVLLILLGAALALYFTSSSQIAALQDQVSDLRVEAADADKRFTDKNQELRDLSVAVGFRDEANASSTSDLPSLAAEVDETIVLLGVVTGAQGDAVPLAKVVNDLQAAVAAERTARAGAQSAYESELSARESANQRSNDIQNTVSAQLSAKDDEIATLNRRIQDITDDYQGRFDDIIAQQTTDDQARRDAEDALAALETEVAKQLASADQRVKAAMARRPDPEPESPDGEILQVSDTGSVAWINVGGRHGLRAGTRFEVLRVGSSGQLTQRGVVEVREVESDMAKVGLLGKANAFDPILAGDLVSNPHFRKNESLHFYLLGQFPMGLSKEFVTSRLSDLGGHVDTAIGASTDVLVLGEKDLSEGEFATELTDTDEYHMADKWGVRIVRLDDLAGFLRY